MNGRTSFGLLALALTLGSGGCVTTQTQKNTDIATPANLTKSDETPIPTKRPDGPKRSPLASTEIAFGKMKEADADADAAKGNPEAQARLRDEARRAYQQALKTDPNNLEAHRRLGNVYVKSNDFERAIEVYKKAMAKHPNDPTLWYDVGVCHLRRKDFQESARCFSKALEMEPENRDYMKKLGFTLAWTGQVDQGLALLTRAQGAPLAHYNIARVLLQREQHQLARHHLNIALRANNQLAEARELLEALDSPSARH